MQVRWCLKGHRVLRVVIRKAHNTQGCAEGTLRSSLAMSLVVRYVDGELVVLVVHLRGTGRLIASAISILVETSGRLIVVHNGQLVEATDH